MAETEPNPATSTSPSMAAEPIPEWGPALRTWQWAWEMHWIGFGTLFTLFAVYSLITMIEIISIKRRTKRGHLALVITSLLLIFGLTRGLFLFINPYESEQCNLLPACPVILTRILFGIALPCITASFSLVHLAFLQVMKLKLYPEKLQSGRFLSAVIVFHFSLTFFAEVMVSLFASWKTLSIICQSFYIVLNLVLSVSFMYSGTKIVNYVQTNHTHVSRLGQTSKRGRDTNGKTSIRPYRPNVSKLVKITYITVFLGIASCALQLYSIIGVYNMYLDEGVKTPEPWPWLVFQSVYRAIEFTAVCTLAYVAPRQVSRKPHLFMRCFTRCQKPREKSEKVNSSNGRQSSLKYLTGEQHSAAWLHDWLTVLTWQWIEEWKRREWGKGWEPFRRSFGRTETEAPTSCGQGEWTLSFIAVDLDVSLLKRLH